MNFIKFITVFFFASVLLTSCENEPIDGSLIPDNGGSTSSKILH